MGVTAPGFLITWVSSFQSWWHAEERLPCNVDLWVPEVFSPPPVGELGYHVLCARPGLVQVYPNGARVTRPPKISFNAGSLRKDLTELLRIRSELTFQVDDEPMVFQKQPFAIYTEAGERLGPGTEELAIEELSAQAGGAPVVMLLFDGGSWRWPSMHVGYKREVMPGVTLRTVSRETGLFEVAFDDQVMAQGSSHLSTELLSDVIRLAEPHLEPSQVGMTMETGTADSVRSSFNAWLPYFKYPELAALQAGTMELLRTTHEETQTPLQVLRYAVGQKYDTHRDHFDPREIKGDAQRFVGGTGFWENRHATLLWYLSKPEEGGETWFPRATGGPPPFGEWAACDTRGAKVSPSNATAVLFYNLRADGNLDEMSWHCGCAVTKGVKWAANSWIRNTAPREAPDLGKQEM